MTVNPVEDFHLGIGGQHLSDVVSVDSVHDPDSGEDEHHEENFVARRAGFAITPFIGSANESNQAFLMTVY
jgi:hypothetical protein